MKYTRPELTPAGSALALVQHQTETKGSQFNDRIGLPVGLNDVADPAAYEADE